MCHQFALLMVPNAYGQVKRLRQQNSKNFYHVSQKKFSGKFSKLSSHTCQIQFFDTQNTMRSVKNCFDKKLYQSIFGGTPRKREPTPKYREFWDIKLQILDSKATKILKNKPCLMKQWHFLCVIRENLPRNIYIYIYTYIEREREREIRSTLARFLEKLQRYAAVGQNNFFKK